ncbi:MAG: hypothetical protein U9Q27_03365 [Patescibacteria group bacterium]|nr:hypothetical protein [Patescibacteria group bacterium]
MLNIIGIKCENKFFISKFTPNSYKKYSFPEGLIINGKDVKSTFHQDWGVISKKVSTVQKYVKQPNINHRYELLDLTLESSKIKSTLKEEDVLDGDYCWKDEYKIYRSLYKEVSDKQPDILEDVEFKYETIIEVGGIKKNRKFVYDVQKTRWAHEGLKQLKENDIHHQLIDQIVFPNILLSVRPCSLTPKQSFDIVRQYVKQYINYDVASITSDYDFCFAVKKKIPLFVPEKYAVLKTKYNKSMEVECFNIAPKKYQSYEIIKGFKGETQEDLKNNIDYYCKKLIKFINEPVISCPHCKGLGIIDKKVRF